MQIPADGHSQVIISLGLSLGKQLTVTIIQDIFRDPFPHSEGETGHIDSIRGKVDLRSGADPDGKDEDDAGTHYGALSGHRCSTQCPWLV